MKTESLQSLSKLSRDIYEDTWRSWEEYYWHPPSRRTMFNEEKVQPLTEDSADKKALDMIVALLAATGTPPKAYEVVLALGIPDVSKTIVYSAIDSLRRKGFLPHKEDVETFGKWGAQAVLAPLRHSDGSPYSYRDWPVARKAVKRARTNRPASTQYRLPFKSIAS
jgi:hypothetical protein